MRALSATDILRIWEWGEREGPTERAMFILATGAGRPLDELARLPIGARDDLLLSLRELTFGSTLDMRIACPACANRLSLSFPTAPLRGGEASSAELGAPIWLDEEGITVRVRAATSEDLTAIARAGNVETARQRLIERCVARTDGEPLEAALLSEASIAALSEQMTQADPRAEIFFALDCPACGHGWPVLFDIAAFFWRELAAEADRLLFEVDALARVYHWREADILSMSSRRRQAYLEKAGA
jgi:hypothetical protein